jgi:phosphatidylglycerophosphate synthase
MPSWRKRILRFLEYVAPNALTASRLLLTAWAAIVMNFPGAWHPFAPFKFAIVILIVAALTDVFDGPVARKFNTVTRFGDGFDHVVDSIMAGLFLYQGYTLLENTLFWLLFFSQIVTMGVSINHFMAGIKQGWPNAWGRTSFILLVIAMCLRMVTINSADEIMGYELSALLIMSALVLRAWSLKEYWISLE